MVREDLVEGAITFLQDPSVSSSPVEQKVAFLRSKNLTQEEIDVSLARTGQPTTQSAPPTSYPQQYRSPQQYGGYQQPPPGWGQPPLEPPSRDWRDWFIMATVLSGAGYAMYWTAKRYIYPLVAPPTAPQLEQDKAGIDASFDKAFALLDQLATDTQELKDAEQQRKERLDDALGDIESVVAKLKEANDARESEAKRMAKEMTEIREQIPLAIQKEKESSDEKIKELIGEMKSLKTLVNGRMGGQPRTAPRATGAGGVSSYTVNGSAMPMSSSNATAATPGLPESDALNGSQAVNGSSEEPMKTMTGLPDRSSSSSPFNRGLSGGKAQIPAWQLAAKKKNDEVKSQIAGIPGVTLAPGSQVGVSESGTVSEEQMGA